MGAIILRKRVYRRNPPAQMPMVIMISVSLGRYSRISPRGDGTKAGMIIPIPFSIQIPRKARTQARLNQLYSEQQEGVSRMMAAVTLNPMAVQIQGWSLAKPCRPRNRYRAEAA